MVFITFFSEKLTQKACRLSDMLKAKDGEFFVTDWLRNRNTLEYIGIWERVRKTNFK